MVVVNFGKIAVSIVQGSNKKRHMLKNRAVYRKKMAEERAEEL